jgi:hypothetical protein
VRTKWKLAALAFLAIAVLLVLVAPLASLEVKVVLPSAAITASPVSVSPTATLISKIILAVVALVMLGVLAWVARHVLRRPRDPDA